MDDGSAPAALPLAAVGLWTELSVRLLMVPTLATLTRARARAQARARARARTRTRTRTRPEPEP